MPLVNGKTPERDAAFEKYVLQQLRCARRRIQLLVNEIDTIGVALRAGAISAEDALLALHQAGSLNFLWAPPPSPVNWETLDSSIEEESYVEKGRKRNAL